VAHDFYAIRNTEYILRIAYCVLDSSHLMTFPGFTSSETFTQLPDSLFHLLGGMDDLDELKVTLYVLWRFEHLEARMRYLSPAAASRDGFSRPGCRQRIRRQPWHLPAICPGWRDSASALRDAQSATNIQRHLQLIQIIHPPQ